MKSALKVMSIIAVVIGALAIINSMNPDATDAFAAFVGGGLYLAEGVLALTYLGQEKKELAQ